MYIIFTRLKKRPNRKFGVGGGESEETVDCNAIVFTRTVLFVVMLIASWMEICLSTKQTRMNGKAVNYA